MEIATKIEQKFVDEGTDKFETKDKILSEIIL